MTFIKLSCNFKSCTDNFTSLAVKVESICMLSPLLGAAFMSQTSGLSTKLRQVDYSEKAIKCLELTKQSFSKC